MANLVILLYIWAVFDEESDIPTKPKKTIKTNSECDKKNDSNEGIDEDSVSSEDAGGLRKRKI